MKEKVRAWEGLSSSPNSDIMSWQEVSYITRWKKVGTHCQSSLPPSSGPRTRDCKSPSDVSTQVNELAPHLCAQWMVYWFFFYLKVVNSVVFFLNVKIRWLVWKINKILYNPKILSRILLYLSRNNYVLFWFVFVLLVPKLLVFPNQPDSVMAMGKSRSVIFPREGSAVAWLSLLQESDILLQYWTWVAFICLIFISFISFIIPFWSTTFPSFSFYVVLVRLTWCPPRSEHLTNV